MKSYSNLKESGLDWLKDIPAHWKLLKLKYVFNNLDYKRIPLSSEERGSMKHKIYDYYGASGVIDKVENYIFDEPLILIGEDGANLYSRSTPLAFVAEGKYWVNNHAHILKPKNGNLYYWANLLESIDYTTYITGSAQPKLTQDALANIVLPVPSLEEQRTIWKYLSEKLKDIDSLIEGKKALITLLEEKRQSTITEAVTKGLNPNVKMKDSGVEWIGEIPEYWELSRIKYVASLLNGDRGENYPSGNDFVDEGIPFITSHSLNKQYVEYSKVNYITEERYQLLRGIKIKDKDIIYCLRGSVGKNAFVTKDGGTIASSLMGIRANNKIHSGFLSYLLNSNLEIGNRMVLTTGSVSDNLSAENVGTYIITLPNLQEQLDIITVLDKKTKLIDESILSMEFQIQKLKDYRQSLIYEAVTGKIDVRDFEVKE
ncbi:restriction endonuclease subunit S [Bacillus cereus]|uniref:restriction endonuclease subunit S n=1 Tax=Bacillus cereus TaxID=1396 RepID=UPI00065DD792|nr:restriction endonuclease subunit S [Bacillus cereus]